MCEMDNQRRNAMAFIGLEIGHAIETIQATRKAMAGLRLKDIEVLDRLEGQMREAAQYLADELEGEQ